MSCAWYPLNFFLKTKSFFLFGSAEMMHPSSIVEKPAQDRQLFDHRPLQLNEDDYQRVCRIPKHKVSHQSVFMTLHKSYYIFISLGLLR